MIITELHFTDPSNLHNQCYVRLDGLSKSEIEREINYQKLHENRTRVNIITSDTRGGIVT